MADQISPFTPAMQQQIEQLLAQQTDRSARTTPIHQAAMAMAARMAPGYAQQAMTPSSAPMSSGSIFQPGSSSGSSSGPGIGATAGAAFIAALLKKDSPLLAMLSKLMGFGGEGGAFAADGTFTGASSVPGATGSFSPPPVFGAGGGGSGDPTQPGGGQGQGTTIGLPFSSAWGGSGSPPTGPGGNQSDYYDDDTRKSR